MKNLVTFFFTLILISLVICPLKSKGEMKSDDIQTLKDILKNLSDHSGNELFSIHFQSMLDVIEAKGALTKTDSSFLAAMLPTFNDPLVAGNASLEESYLNRSRQLVISWVSPTDGKTSFFRLRLPKNWNPDKLYPLYVELHGLWDVANNPVDFMTYAYRQGPSTSITFEDGYQILPWGRGNLWYQGISETDIWEGIDRIENLLQIDPSRKYLTGHSMGGYGAWSIASKSPHVWAGLGIHAGALWYGSTDMFSEEIIESLKAMPTYFVVGLSDGLYNYNLTAYMLLQSAGNENIQFVSFDGGHDYLGENVKNMYLWLKEFVNEDFLAYDKLKKKGKNAVLFCPNPVRNQTTIKINIKEAGHVRLELFDTMGRLAGTVIDSVFKEGESQVVWKRDSLHSGIYSYSFTTGAQRLNGKIVLY